MACRPKAPGVAEAGAGPQGEPKAKQRRSPRPPPRWTHGQLKPPYRAACPPGASHARDRGDALGTAAGPVPGLLGKVGAAGGDVMPGCTISIGVGWALCLPQAVARGCSATTFSGPPARPHQSFDKPAPGLERRLALLKICMPIVDSATPRIVPAV
jgi:hypothetical protein